jgi:hypothetical protein
MVTVQQKRHARYLAKRHIKALPCVVCGSLLIERHHEDYNKPLEVIMLCCKHHNWQHKVIGKSRQYFSIKVKHPRGFTDIDLQALLIV